MLHISRWVVGKTVHPSIVHRPNQLKITTLCIQFQYMRLQWLKKKKWNKIKLYRDTWNGKKMVRTFILLWYINTVATMGCMFIQVTTAACMTIKKYCINVKTYYQYGNGCDTAVRRLCDNFKETIRRILKVIFA